MKHLFMLVPFMVGCGQEIPKDNVLEIERFATSSLPGITVKIGTSEYNGKWNVLIPHEGPLEDLPDDLVGHDKEYSPILFTDEEPQFRASLSTHSSGRPGTSKRQVEFYCDPYQEELPTRLKRQTIYFYDTKLRDVVEIGSFSESNEHDAIEAVARSAITTHIEQGDAGNP